MTNSTSHLPPIYRCGCAHLCQAIQTEPYILCKIKVGWLMFSVFAISHNTFKSVYVTEKMSLIEKMWNISFMLVTRAYQSSLTNFLINKTECLATLLCGRAKQSNFTKPPFSPCSVPSPICRKETWGTKATTVWRLYLGGEKGFLAHGQNVEPLEHLVAEI